MKNIILILLLGLLSTSVYADRETEQSAVADIAPKLQEAWNDQDFEKLLALYHKVSRLRYEMEQIQDDEKVERIHLEMMKEFGEMKVIEVGSYDSKKKEFILSVTYSKKGKVDGAISISPNGDSWLIRDWDIDG
ncbi:hypothetical protein [Cerasicoccus arenae]|uniref:DUF3887 domain-containing protein n=1 Tax=Cerasicoccus arenae TaxID=424488 RepID=A0A8J3DDH0_9BACT|nr:hypothetical protein [Cerasicoccus arenae]MBK1860078.1 hypothetical protein [Cerasicoccus arenae]GHC14159.1 hypothetical protein GCM10007047_34240 [Cerasicoccus arenae]